MRVLIDASFAARAQLSGTGIYIQRLIDDLAIHGSVEVIEAVNPGRRAPAGGGLGSVRNLAADLYWSGVELPSLARRTRADLIHHPLPAFAPLAGVPQVITVHDTAFALFPELFTRGYGTYARLSHRAAARRARGVVCVSEATAADVRRLWGVPASRITVASLGPGQELARVSPAAGVEPQHFLYVGDDEPRKNLQVLIDGYAEYRALAEAAGARVLGLVLAGSARRRPAPGVTIVARPDADVLAGLYAGAAALVHPAVHEGFGLTPLEAMRLGVPVIAAPSAGVVEVCGEAVRYAATRDPAAFATAMVEIAGSAELRATMAERGLARAEAFSWARCARAHVDAYARALRD